MSLPSSGPLSLGIDTGGTFTDAVLYDPATDRILAAAKRLTTRHDLSLGIGAAIDAVLSAAPQAGPIGLVSLSTTLATNAVVEGQGSPAALILIGYPDATLDRAGLRAALGGDPVFMITGGHRSSGEEQAPLDRAAVEAAIRDAAPRVGAFAVAGFFSVRNPAHEIAVREMIGTLTDRPVSCGHELSSALDAPRRALTALLNARLIPLTAGLVDAVRAGLERRGIVVPLMVVKGDGSLISDRTARLRPVETILSGPAASVVGARHLTGAEEAVVSDIGGTTTDIAVLRGGRPVLSRDGARVGGWRTMVEAVEILTIGLGGDSELRIDPAEGLVLGPRRSVPLALLAVQHPETLTELAAQAERGSWRALDGLFALRHRPLHPGEGLAANEQRIWDALAAGPKSLDQVLTSHLLDRALDRLIARGLVVLAGFTPTDAAHILGRQDLWSREAAMIGARIWIARPSEPGWQPPPDVESFAGLVVDRLVTDSARAIAEAALTQDGAADPAAETRGWLARQALAGDSARRGGRLLESRLALTVPLACIGAGAPTYYPAVAARLGTDLLLSAHAGVTNAVGAVVSGVVQTVRVTITSPEEGVFRVHAPAGTTTFAALEPAAERATALAEAEARRRAAEAGAAEAAVSIERDDRFAHMAGGLSVFVESVITATAAGRPAATTV